MLLTVSWRKGATRCRKHCENRREQFNSVFDAGDEIAISALKDVVISLQTEVIQALHIARAVENAILDFTSLHESSVTNRKDALRAMDQLCQRLMASVQFQAQRSVNESDATIPSRASIHSSFRSLQPSDIVESYDNLPPSPPASFSIGSPQQSSSYASPRTADLNETFDRFPSPPASGRNVHQPVYQRALPPIPQRGPSIRRPSDTASQQSRYNAQQQSSLGWISGQVNNDGSVRSVSQASSSTPGNQQYGFQNADDAELRQKRGPSVEYSSRGGEGASNRLQSNDTTSPPTYTSRHLQFQSPVSATTSQYTYDQSASSATNHGFPEDRKERYNSTTATSPQHDSNQSQATSSQSPQHSQQGTILTEKAAALAPRASEQNSRSSFAEAAYQAADVKATRRQPLCLPRIETAEDLWRASEAPEVVSKDFEGLYVTTPSPKEEKVMLAIRTQADYQERLLTLPIGMENIWLPLKRPAMHNRYHGFCKGAWEIRKDAHQGIQVQLTASLKEPVLHWACRECKFRSKAPNEDALPNQILFNQKYNVRYRWLFLAKSHRSTETASEVAENYMYSCIFCAAQGQNSACHEKLEHLIVHIISKHKTATMTKEVKEKTKCVVGSDVNKEADWDINVPESGQKGAGVATDEFFISASKFLRRRKGKRP